jgi:hypothetical protein
MAATLIFPCCVPAALAYAEAARQRGETVVAASSLAYDETAARYQTWFHLPSVYDSEFVPALNEAIRRHDIDRVFAPVSSAHWKLARLAAAREIPLQIIGDLPVQRHAREHGALMRESASRLAQVGDISGGDSTLGLIDVAAVLRRAMGFFGETDETKIAAMMAVFAHAPEGDVVEIGVLTGRSAIVLEMMARRHRTGAVLCIDPWAYAHSVQHESPTDLQEMVDIWDASVPFETFLVELLPMARAGAFNYLKMTSQDAHASWSASHRVCSPEFGETRYSGRIAVLHIDGNHDLAAVANDLALWLPHCQPGGWLILDDYFWLHGNGPRLAGDRLLTERADDIARAFVCGRALFVQWSSTPVPPA